MFVSQQQSKVADCIVIDIPINVVNMITFRNFSTLDNPNVAVECDFSPFAINLSPAFKVSPIALTFCLRIAMELVTVVRCSFSLHCFPFLIVTISSPTFN